MKQLSRIKLLIPLATLSSLVIGQSASALQRPMILANAEDKVRLEKIMAEHDWAAARLEAMKKNVASHLARHQASPADYLEGAVPAIPAGVHGHGSPLNRAMEAGVLYFMTGEEDYARLAADILNVYVQHLTNEENEVKVSTDGPVRDYWDLYPMVGLTYDFIQPYLIQEGVTVFDKASGERIPFDSVKTQAMFARVVARGFEFWIAGSNHTIMEGAGILYCALAIEDKEMRDAYIRTFMEGSRPMTGMNWMKQHMIDNNGVWPESPHYSGLGSITYILMDAVDRSYPEFDIYSGCEKVLRGFSDRLFFAYPSHKEGIAFGTGNRGLRGRPRIGTGVIHFIRRAGLEDNAKAKALLRHIMAESEDYTESSTVSHTSRGGHWLYQQFLSMNTLEGYEPKRIESQAITIPYAGVVLQNNLHGDDPKEDGMMYYTGGGEHVHSALSGLNLEFFGGGYVMNGVGAIYAPRSAPIYNGYYRIHAGHNTVVVNEASRGGTRGFWGYQSMLYMDTVRMEGMEPKPYTPAVSRDFTFSSQRLYDTVNHATQQRVVGILRTSGTTGYYFDLFRSRSNIEDKCHDYIYRNIGDRFLMRKDSGTELPLRAAPDRYQSFEVTEDLYWGRRTMVFPGWHYFSDVMTSAPAADSIHGTFHMDALQRYNHVFMPGGFDREYTYAQAPAISSAVEPYASSGRANRPDRTKAQVLTIRQPGEAWNRPFIAVYEPSANETATVRSVENIMDGETVVGAVVVSQVGDRRITDRIIARDRPFTRAYRDEETGLSFDGRYAVVRTIDSPAGRELQLYIGDGSKLSFLGHELTADGSARGLLSIKL